MLIALLFSYLISLIVGGEAAPFLLVENTKIVKKHVIDEERRDSILFILEDAKDQHKAIQKETKAISKSLNKLAKNRDAQREDFEAMARESYKLRVEMQEVNLNAVMKSRNLITEEEWELIGVEFFEENAKTSKLVKKRVKQIQNGFDKTEKKFRRVINEGEGAEASVISLREFETSFLYVVSEYVKFMLNDDAVVYSYNVPREEVMVLQRQHIENLANVFDALVDLHFVLVDNSSEKEWKKIDDKLKLPF